ncbi:MAG: hypothetical protein N2C14_23900, partial [Planctomycetales bacterium]
KMPRTEAYQGSDAKERAASYLAKMSDIPVQLQQLSSEFRQRSTDLGQTILTPRIADSDSEFFSSRQ